MILPLIWDEKTKYYFSLSFSSSWRKGICAIICMNHGIYHVYDVCRANMDFFFMNMCSMFDYFSKLRPWSFKLIVVIISWHYQFFSAIFLLVLYSLWLIHTIDFLAVIISYHFWKIKVQTQWSDFLAFLRYFWWKHSLQQQLKKRALLNW